MPVIYAIQKNYKRMRTKNLFTITVVGAMLTAACNSTKKTSGNTVVVSNDLDAKPLFDGKTLNGWRTYQNKPADSWTVLDGILHCKGSTTDKSDRRADLITADQYENFDLSLEWKIAPQGNSGIMYLVSETESAAYLTGPEYQIIDDIGFPQKLEDWQKTGANYAMHTALNAKPNPVGEWNKTRILVNKGHVEHWLNGEKIVEYEMGSDDWKKRKSTGKWKDTPAYGTVRKGHIALQDHGSEAWFRNITIRQL